MSVRIAICHQTFAGGDAIGRDITGMCATLTACGHEVFILCECDAHRSSAWPISHDFASRNLRSADIIVYHHSQDWPLGRCLLADTTAPVLLKFHNITPPDFFAPYAPDYAKRCAEGEKLTVDLARSARVCYWLCDSAYNADIAAAAGVDSARVAVVPPYNNSDMLLREQNSAIAGESLSRFLFAGRFAPNKGHRHLIRFANAYRSLYGDSFELSIIGAIDPSLRGYWEEFTALVHELDLAKQVRVYPHLSDRNAHALFQSAHVYLTFSEHEGFCVPVVEAQSVGIPVVGSGATAVRETAGPQQFLGGGPFLESDYDFYAELAHMAAHDACLRQNLIDNGRRNVLRRFTTDRVEAAFLDAVVPWLLPAP